MNTSDQNKNRSYFGVRIKANSEKTYHPAEKQFIDAMQSIVSKYGKLEDQDKKGIWVGYVAAKENDNYSIGISLNARLISTPWERRYNFIT